MPKSKIRPHARERLQERYEGCNSKELDRAIKARSNVQFARKLTNSRSLVYVTLSTGIVKCIINRERNQVITVLPWQDRYQVEVEVVYEGDIYRATIYPDAYKETKASNCLTLIQQIFREHQQVKDQEVCTKTIGPGTDLFQTIFNLAWAQYQEKGGYHVATA